MTYTCLSCQLSDPYHGDGDGIGSCDCIRCDCCGAGPQLCDCGKDWDGDPDEGWDTERDQPMDLLCNDEACPYRQSRAEWRRIKDAERIDTRGLL